MYGVLILVQYTPVLRILQSPVSSLQSPAPLGDGHPGFSTHPQSTYTAAFGADDCEKCDGRSVSKGLSYIRKGLLVVHTYVSKVR